MKARGNPFRAELHPLPRTEGLRRSVIQAIEPEAEQVLRQAGGRVFRSHGDFVYEEHWDCPWPTLLVVWPPETSMAYLAPTGQEDGNVIFLAAHLPGSLTELHLTYDYRPFAFGGELEEFLTLRLAETRLLGTMPPGTAVVAPSSGR